MTEKFRKNRAVTELSGKAVFPDLAICVAGYYEKAAGHYCKRDHVTDYQVAYCVEGKGTITCSGKIVPVEKGSVFINIPGHPHCYWADEKEPWTLWWVHFRGENGARYFELLRCQPKEPAFRVGLHDRLIDLFKELLRELSRPDEAHQAKAVALLHMILSTLVQLRRQAGHALHGHRGRMAVDMEKLNEYIDANLSCVTLKSMALFANMSIPHFERLFTRRTGYSPVQYVIRRKVSAAGNLLLRKKDLSVKEISLAVGCEDEHYFSRFFKKVTGLTPLQYRQKYG